MLSAKGLLTVGLRTGTRVRPRRDWNLLDPQLLEWQPENGTEEHFFHNVCEIRSSIEPKAAELVALRGNRRILLRSKLLGSKCAPVLRRLRHSLQRTCWFHNAIMDGLSQRVALSSRQCDQCCSPNQPRPEHEGSAGNFFFFPDPPKGVWGHPMP